MAGVDGGTGRAQRDDMRALGLYVFGLDGTVLGTKAYGESVPIRADQVGGLLALTGTFQDAGVRPAAGVTARIRFDEVDVVSVRGSRGVVAAAYRASTTGAPADEIHRILTILDKRWPYGSTDGRRAKRPSNALRGPDRPTFRGATILASVLGIFSRTAR